MINKLASVYLFISLIEFNLYINLQKIDENELKLLLNETEWISIAGPGDKSKNDLCYSFLWATFQNNTGKLVLRTDLLNKQIELFLKKSQKLLAPNFTVIKRWMNRTEEFNVNSTAEDDQCHYRGNGIALTLCGEIRGIITLKDYYYTIHPLPRRIQVLFGSVPYVIVKKSHQKKRFQCKATTHHEAHINFVEPNTRRIRSVKSSRTIHSSSLPDEIFVETAIFVDQDLFEHMKLNYPHETERELIRFVLATVNAVQLLYHDVSLGRSVNFLLKRLEILHEEPSGLIRSLDIDQYLNSFCHWQKEQNHVNDYDPQHWDHALILTGLDLYVINRNGLVSNQVVGNVYEIGRTDCTIRLAPVSGMCTTTSSCTVNEGKHFESVYVVAHEIGHNLGMRHDGSLANNNCDPSSFIMSPTLGSGKITWSPCSRNYLNKFIQSSQSKCLLDHGVFIDQLDHSKSGTLPGERFNADQQCMLKYGNGSHHAYHQYLSDICRDLHCERDKYTWTSHPALEGSKCGDNSWCRSGLCVLKNQTDHEDNFLAESNDIYENKEMLNTKWTDWQTDKKCYSSCLYSDNSFQDLSTTGLMTYVRECGNLRGQNFSTESTCNGINRKVYTCKPENCESMTRLTVQDYIDDICKRARRKDLDLNGYGYQRTTYSRDDACTVWCDKVNGGVKNHGHSLPDGIKCHLKGRSSQKPRFCVGGRCEDFYCEFENRTQSGSQFIYDSDVCSSKMAIKKARPQRRHTNDKVLWVPISGCFYNCLSDGKGFRLMAESDNIYKTSIQLCTSPKNNCLKLNSAFEFATNVCNNYQQKVQRLSGKGAQIPSTKDEPNRGCKVACQDEHLETRFYIVNGSTGWFPFGTNCSKDNNTDSYCLRGSCIDFGPDDMPLVGQDFSIPSKKRKKRHSPVSVVIEDWNLGGALDDMISIDDLLL